MVHTKGFWPTYFNFLPDYGIIKHTDMELDYLEIGQNIRRQRLKQGLKQRELAERANVSSQHMSYIKTGRAQVNLPTFVAIFNACQTDCNTLLGETLTGGQNILCCQKFEETFTAMVSKKIQLCYEISRLIAEWDL